MKFTGLLVDVSSSTPGFREIEVENTLEAYYECLNCDLVNIVVRNIGDRRFTIVCDDEGIFRNPVVVSAINSIGKPMLVGSLLICNEDADGNLASLSDDDIDYILHKGHTGFQIISVEGHKEVFHYITGVEYPAPVDV